MPPTSPAACALARRLLARAGTPTDAGHAPREPVAAAEWVARALAAELSRWLGPYGYHTLLARALADALHAHPALAAVRVRAPSDPTLEGLADAARTHGSDAVADAAAGLLAGVVDLLGRLIGEDMAAGLLERAVPVPNTTLDAERVANEESPS
jgi:hypothetical protein